MTRFARAKGSKASNERVPEESTPWSEMKQQLVERQTEENDKDKRKEFEAMRHANYNKFLKELSNKSADSSWADFPETSKTSKPEKSAKNTEKDRSESEMKPKKKRKSKQFKNECQTTETDIGKSPALKEQNTDVNGSPALKKQKNGVSGSPAVKTQKNGIDGSPAAKKQKTDINGPALKKQKMGINGSAALKKQKKEQKQTKKNEVNKHEKLDTKSKKVKKTDDNADIDDEITEMCKNLDPEMESRYESLIASIEQKLEKEMNSGDDFEEMASDDDKDEEFEDKDVQNDSQSIVEPENDEQDNLSTDLKITKKSKPKESQQQTSKSQNVKDKNNKDYARRKLDDKKEYIFINGEKEEVVKFNGFPIRKSDADRLKSLKTDMISKGIPQSEIQRTMKLERRRAEKALARFRKVVCFHCRKLGHLLSLCPDLNSESGPIETNAIGICFKCGSTEHTHNNCRVTKKDEFKFAQCFICKEQGHISRQCPDNPRGLYPAGGSCRLCGDVTHLKKDCPKTMQDKANQQFTLDVISDNIEMEGSDEKRKTKDTFPKQKKIIKF